MLQQLCRGAAKQENTGAGSYATDPFFCLNHHARRGCDIVNVAVCCTFHAARHPGFGVTKLAWERLGLPPFEPPSHTTTPSSQGFTQTTPFFLLGT